MAQQKTITWHNEKRRVSDLIPHTKNPRSLSDQQKKDLTESIEKFGLAEIPAINTNNTLLAGHQRCKILLALGRGHTEIDVRVPSRKLSKKECEEYLLRSNRNTGSWNYELLKNFDTDFLLDIGFDDLDLSEIWDNELLLEDDEFDEEKEIEKAKHTDIKDGDMFKLGNHTLICGDSTQLATVQRVVGKNKVDMVLNDPPYNISLDYDKGLGKRKKYGGKVNDSLSDTEYQSFLESNLRNALLVCKPDAHIFYWCDQGYVGMLQNLYASNGISYKRTVLWVKNGINPTPKIAFNKCYEPCVYGVIGKPYLSEKHKKFNEVLNPDVGTGNATIDDIANMIDIWLERRISGDQYKHPTQKPITLFDRPLNRCTKIGDSVLILFGGSGSELLACEQLKRKAFVVEKSPVFTQLIINRYEKLTGNKAKKIN